MPTYTFEIIETGEQYDEMMKISERDDYIKNNPQVKPVMTAPNFVGDHIVKRMDGGMKETLQKIADKNPNSPLADRFSRRSAKDIQKQKVVKKYNLILIEDAAHAFGCQISQCPKSPYIGSFADMTTFSFHPVKPITTCEGGMIVTNNKVYHDSMKRNRTHGISIDYKIREKTGSHYYDMTSLGYNYRIPDLLCALGISQLKKIDEFTQKRRNIANQYNIQFAKLKKWIIPLTQKYDSAYHIYIIKLQLDQLTATRDEIFKVLQFYGLGVNVHYKPIHLHSFYQDNFNTLKEQFPIAEKVYNQIITLPLFPSMKKSNIKDVINIVTKVILHYSI